MSERIIHIAKQTIVDSFEKTAFMFLDELEDASALGEKICACVNFTGEFGKGSLLFEASPAFTLELASNLLGDEDLEIGKKGLLEMLNISAGHFLTDSFGFECETHLGIPSEDAGSFEYGQSQQFSFASDSENQITIHLHLDLSK